jgi:hypothetical protein
MELDLEMGWGACVGVDVDLDERIVAAEFARETGWGTCVEVEVDLDERTVAAEFVREMEGKADGSRLLEVEGALDNGDGN